MTGPPADRYYPRYEDFLAADPRRREAAHEFGHDWHDGRHRYRICWYPRTHELTAERLSTTEPLELEDFDRGVSGPVEILHRIASQEKVERLLRDQLSIFRSQSRTLEGLRALLATERRPRLLADPPDSAA